MLDSGRYRVSFRHVSQTDKNHFSSSHVILPISVGQPYHEGEKFTATVKKCIESFKQTTVLIADTLQRHNHLDEPDPHAYTLRLGDEWMQRNAESLGYVDAIVRWDDILNGDSFYKIKENHDLMEKIKKSFNFNLDISDYLQRPDRHSHASITHSLGYLIEEIQAIFSLRLQNKYDFFLYPKPNYHTLQNAIIFPYPKLHNLRPIQCKLRRVEKLDRAHSSKGCYA